MVKKNVELLIKEVCPPSAIACATIVLIALVYLVYSSEFGVTVPDGWPMIRISGDIWAGNYDIFSQTLAGKRPMLIPYYAINALAIYFGGLQGAYINIFLHIALSALLIFWYFKREQGDFIAFIVALLCLLYPSHTGQSALYIGNYYQALILVFAALLMVDRHPVTSTILLLMSLGTLESCSVLFLLHPFVARSNFVFRLRRTAGIFFLVFLLYLSWRFFLFPLYHHQVDVSAQSTVEIPRFLFHFFRGIVATFWASHGVLWELLQQARAIHIVGGAVVGVVLYWVARRESFADAPQGDANSAYSMLGKAGMAITHSGFCQALTSARGVACVRFVSLVLAGGLLAAGYIASPPYMATRFSPDGEVERAVLIELAYLRYLLVVGGGFLLAFSLASKFVCSLMKAIVQKVLRLLGSPRDRELLALIGIGFGFSLLGYIFSIFRAATPSANIFGEFSRTHFVSVVGASLVFAALLAIVRNRSARIAWLLFCLYAGALVAFRLELQKNVAEMGVLQRQVWGQIVEQAPCLKKGACVVLLVEDANMRREHYVNDWDDSPDIPTRRDRPLSAVRALNGIAWGENVALNLLYGTTQSSQVLLLTSEELDSFFIDQGTLLSQLQVDSRGNDNGLYYDPGQVVLFEYREGSIQRRRSYSYRAEGAEINVQNLGDKVVYTCTNSPPVYNYSNSSQRSKVDMRELLLYRQSL